MPKSAPAKRSRNWTLTLNNYTEDEVADFKSLTDHDHVKCAAFAYEVGEEGTPHLQGFVIFKVVKSLRAAKKILGARYHIECMKGTVQQSVDYCSKQSELFTFGTLPMTQKEKGAAGKQAYEDAWNLAKLGKIEEIDPGLRLQYYNTLNKIHKDFQPKVPDNATLCNYWIYGPSGTGKSRAVRHKFGEHGFYNKMCNKWWDGYADEDVVLLDDFNHAPLGHHLKIWGDHYGFQAEVKGSSKKIRPKVVIVTSNYHPRDVWDDERTYLPIERRYKIIKLEKLGDPGTFDWEGLPALPPVKKPLVKGFVPMIDLTDGAKNTDDEEEIEWDEDLSMTLPVAPKLRRTESDVYWCDPEDEKKKDALFAKLGYDPY